MGLQKNISEKISKISKIVVPSDNSIGLVSKIVLQRTLALALASISTISFLVYQNNVLPITKKMLVYAEVLDNVEKCQFTNISYNQESTNRSIPIDIQTSNGDYDATHIKNKDTCYIHQNGMYTVTLIKEYQIVDEQII